MTASLRSRLEVWFGSASGTGSLFRTDADVLAALRGDQGRRRPTDLVLDGARLECVVGEVLLLTESGDGPPFAHASTAGGDVALFGPRGFRGISGRARPDDVVSVAHDDQAPVSLHVDGTLRVGGERIATIDRARRVRGSGRGVLAVVSEHEGGSAVRLLTTRGSPLALLAEGLPLGGAAWSPDGTRLAVRTPTGVAIHDASGALVEAIPIDSDARQLPVSGSVAWTARGILALHDSRLVLIDDARRVRAFPDTGETLLSLAAMHEGPLVALTTIAEVGGLSFVDLDTGEHARISWATRFFPSSPITFTAGDRALVWADYAGLLNAVPFGALAVDPESGRALDEDAAYVHALGRRREGLTSEADLRSLLGELDARKVRAGLASAVAMVRSQIVSTLRDRAQKARADALFVPPASAPFAVGDRARHAKFGEGPVTATEGSGAEAKITVAFESGPRTLKASFLTRA